jgi:hypothetical protein
MKYTHREPRLDCIEFSCIDHGSATNRIPCCNPSRVTWSPAILPENDDLLITLLKVSMRLALLRSFAYCMMVSVTAACDKLANTFDKTHAIEVHIPFTQMR